MDAVRRRSSNPWRRLLLLSSSSSAASDDPDLDEREILWGLHGPETAAEHDDSYGSDTPETVRRNASSSSSARAIPAPPKKLSELVMARSAPINIPTEGGRGRRAEEMLVEEEEEEAEEEDEVEDDEPWMPPHEIVARTWEKRNMTCYSVLEGAGRTLKGRDLRRVRNAVWQQTGFLD